MYDATGAGHLMPLALWVHPDYPRRLHCTAHGLWNWVARILCITVLELDTLLYA